MILKWMVVVDIERNVILLRRHEEVSLKAVIIVRCLRWVGIDGGQSGQNRSCIRIEGL